MKRLSFFLIPLLLLSGCGARKSGAKVKARTPALNRYYKRVKVGTPKQEITTDLGKPFRTFVDRTKDGAPQNVVEYKEMKYSASRIALGGVLSIPTCGLMLTRLPFYAAKDIFRYQFVFENDLLVAKRIRESNEMWDR